MPKTSVFIPFCLVFLMAATGLSSAQPLRDFEHHVRTEDPQLRTLMRHGFDTSPSFRALIERLTKTDVLVYVQRTHFDLPQLEGQLTFMTTAGGYRYLKVQIAGDRIPKRQLAAIGHELQHALEVADAPAIVCSRTLAEQFAAIGYEKAPYQGARRFESEAAIEAGRRVWKEYVAGD